MDLFKFAEKFVQDIHKQARTKGSRELKVQAMHTEYEQVFQDFPEATKQLVEGLRSLYHSKMPSIFDWPPQSVLSSCNVQFSTTDKGELKANTKVSNERKYFIWDEDRQEWFHRAHIEE